MDANRFSSTKSIYRRVGQWCLAVTILLAANIVESAGVPYIINYGTGTSNAVAGSLNVSNFHAVAYNPGSGGRDVFLVETPSKDVLLRLFPIGASKSNYFTLFFGAFGVTNSINADISDVFFRQSAVGYHAIEFGDETNSFWIQSGIGSWQAFGGDLGGVAPFVELYDSFGNMFWQGDYLTNKFAWIGNFNPAQFTANHNLITIKSSATVTNLISKTTLNTDGQLTVGTDTYSQGNLAVAGGGIGAPFAVDGTLSADSFSGVGSGLTGIPGTGVEGGWTISRVSGSDATTTGQALVDVTGLSYSAAANTTYEFEAVLSCTTTAVTTGTEYGIANTGTAVTTLFVATGATNAATGATYFVSATNAATQPFLLASGQSGVVVMKGFFTTGAGTPSITVRHLKVTSGTSTVKQGSCFKVRKLF